MSHVYFSFTIVMEKKKKKKIVDNVTFFFLLFFKNVAEFKNSFVLLPFRYLLVIMDFGSKYIYKYAHSEEESVSDDDNALDNDNDPLFIPKPKTQ